MDKQAAVNVLASVLPGQSFGAGWCLDTIHHTTADRLLFRPMGYRVGEGIFVTQRGALVSAGYYEGAFPHIGEALFREKWKNEYCDPQDATAAAWHVCEVLSGISPHDGFDVLAAITSHAKRGS